MVALRFSFVQLFVYFACLVQCGKFSVLCHLIGCLHGSTVTNKDCLNCASILLYKQPMGGLEGARIQTDAC